MSEEETVAEVPSFDEIARDLPVLSRACSPVGDYFEDIDHDLSGIVALCRQRRT
jgi:hypothetical protein